MERATSAAEIRQAESFVRRHPGASFGIGSRWRAAIHDTYALPEVTLVARSRGRVVGVAPWHLLWTPLAGAYLCGAPFASFGGPVAEDDEVRDELIRASVAVARRRLCSHAQWKELLGSARPSLGSVEEERFISPWIDLAGGEEGVWSSTLLPRARQFVRKARRLGVAVRDDPVLLDAFCSVFGAGMRSIGSPFHGQPFFRAIRHHFGRDAHFLVAFHEARPAAAALGLLDRGVMHYVFGATVRDLRWTAANTAMLWELVRVACRRGLRAVDLGRSERGGSHHRFKRQWGPHTAPLRAVVLPVLRSRPADLSPTNPALGLAQRAWSALPEEVTRTLGPLLIRGIG